MILAPALKGLGSPKTAGVIYPIHPLAGRFLVFSPALKFWGPLKGPGFCSQSDQFWTMADFLILIEYSNFLPRFEALGTPKMAGFM